MPLRAVPISPPQPFWTFQLCSGDAPGGGDTVHVIGPMHAIALIELGTNDPYDTEETEWYFVTMGEMEQHWYKMDECYSTATDAIPAAEAEASRIRGIRKSITGDREIPVIPWTPAIRWTAL